jgi:hypothetical protein
MSSITRICPAQAGEPPRLINSASNQCRNDPDGAVDADERLTLTDVVPGRYDVELRDKKGRICVIRNVEVLAGKPYAFSISEDDLTDCRE